jgi:hypothetical protein
MVESPHFYRKLLADKELHFVRFTPGPGNRIEYDLVIVIVSLTQQVRPCLSFDKYIWVHISFLRDNRSPEVRLFS